MEIMKIIWITSMKYEIFPWKTFLRFLNSTGVILDSTRSFLKFLAFLVQVSYKTLSYKKSVYPVAQCFSLYGIFNIRNSNVLQITCFRILILVCLTTRRWFWLHVVLFLRRVVILTGRLKFDGIKSRHACAMEGFTASRRSF